MSKKSKTRRTISKKGVGEMLRGNDWSKNEDLSDLFQPDTIYLDANGKALMVFSYGQACLYESVEDFAEVVKLFKQRKQHPPQSNHILAGRFPYGKEFPQHVPELIDNLANLFKISPVELDGTMESLSQVEAKVKRLGRKKCLEAPIFPALIAYMGEAMRLDIKGRWEMYISLSDNKTWEPWIYDAEGRSCTPFIDLYDMLYEPSEPISIRGTAAVLTTSRWIRPTTKPNPDPSTLPTLRMITPDKNGGS